MLGALSKFDAFGSRGRDHLTVRTLSGAGVSMIAAAVMLVLFMSEVAYWRTTRMEDHMVVDTGMADREFDISLDMTMHALPCRDVNIAAEDSKGVPYEEGRLRITKVPLAVADDPRLARAAALNPRHPAIGDAADKPGCKLHGLIRVKKVAGTFHIAAARTLTNVDGRLAFTIPPEVMASYNASHTIHALSFGPPFPGQAAPLDGHASAPTRATAMWQYHLKVVPTLYERLYGAVTDSQQFSASDFVAEYEPSAGVFIHPGVWFRYDFSPILVRSVESRRTFLQFLTSVCAILGGVFTLSGLVDQLLHRTLGAKAD